MTESRFEALDHRIQRLNYMCEHPLENFEPTLDSLP